MVTGNLNMLVPRKSLVRRTCRARQIGLRDVGGGSHGWVHRGPEGRTQSAVRAAVPGAEGVSGLGLQVAPRRCFAPASSSAALSALVAALLPVTVGAYGVLRIIADLRDMGWPISQSTLAAVMAEQGLRARANAAGALRPARVRADGGPRAWSNVTSPQDG